MMDPDSLFKTAERLLRVAEKIKAMYKAYKLVPERLEKLMKDIEAVKELTQKDVARHVSKLMVVVAQFLDTTTFTLDQLEKAHRGDAVSTLGKLFHTAQAFVEGSGVIEKLDKLHTQLEHILKMFEAQKFSEIEENTFKSFQELTSLNEKVDLTNQTLAEIRDSASSQTNLQMHHLNHIQNLKAREYWSNSFPTLMEIDWHSQLKLKLKADAKTQFRDEFKEELWLSTADVLWGTLAANVHNEAGKIGVLEYNEWTLEADPLSHLSKAWVIAKSGGGQRGSQPGSSSPLRIRQHTGGSLPPLPPGKPPPKPASRSGSPTPLPPEAAAAVAMYQPTPVTAAAAAGEDPSPTNTPPAGTPPPGVNSNSNVNVINITLSSSGSSRDKKDKKDKKSSRREADAELTRARAQIEAEQAAAKAKISAEEAASMLRRAQEERAAAEQIRAEQERKAAAAAAAAAARPAVVQQPRVVYVQRPSQPQIMLAPGQMYAPGQPVYASAPQPQYTAAPQPQYASAPQAVPAPARPLTRDELGAKLALAASKDELNMVQYWLSQGAPLDYNDTDGYGTTPVHWATWNNSIPVLKAMIDKDPNAINVLNKYKFTPLHSAAYGSKEIAIRYLLERGASKTAKDYQNRTPYEVASTMKASDSVKKLLKP